MTTMTPSVRNSLKVAVSRALPTPAVDTASIGRRGYLRRCQRMIHLCASDPTTSTSSSHISTELSLPRILETPMSVYL